jgi:hypothetical protein
LGVLYILGIPYIPAAVYMPAHVKYTLQSYKAIHVDKYREIRHFASIIRKALCTLTYNQDAKLGVLI